MICTKCKKETKGLFIYFIDGKKVCKECFEAHLKDLIDRGVILTKHDLSPIGGLNTVTTNNHIASQLAEEKEQQNG